MTTKSAAAPGHPGGYSLLELLATLAIAGTLALVGGPPLQGLVLNERRTAAINDLLLTLLMARSETVKRGKALVVCGVADLNGNRRVDPDERRCAGHDWSAGWLVGTWHDADRDAFVDPGELTPMRVFDAPAPGLRITAGNFTATPPVWPYGTLLVRQFGWRTSNGTITVCDRRGAGHARAVIVSPIGRARASSRRADGTPLRCPAD